MFEAHRIALERSGGHGGVRDVGLIESAIARPYSGYYRSIYQKAAALTHSLAKNHGFIDGNKRSALLTLYLFLDRSGYDLAGGDIGNEIDAMILDVVENRLSFD